MPRSEDFDRVSDLLGDFCERAASPTEVPVRSGGSQASGGHAAGSPCVGDARALADAWPEIAGAEVAANASPVQLKGGRLVVSTSSSVWAHTLQYMSHDLMTRLNDRLGDDTVRQIVFRHAGWEERPPDCRTAIVEHQTGESRSPSSLASEQAKALADLEKLDLPLAVREKMASAMRASFVRAQQGPVR